MAILEKTAADLAAIWRTATNAEKKASAECFAVLESIADIERLPHVMNSGVVAERYQELERLRKQHADRVRKHGLAMGSAADAQERYRAAQRLADTCAASLRG